jgi:mono/diheme cytochrome c family protein
MARQRQALLLFLFVWAGELLLGSSLLAAEKAAPLFKDLCSACHGANGKGDGPGAAVLHPKPVDFTNCKSMSFQSDESLFIIIKGGGQIAGRSPVMPSFGSSLSDRQIHELVAYIRSLCKR